MYVFPWVYVLIVLEYIPRSRTTRLQNMWRFNLIRKCHTLFQNGCITLHSHQWCMSDTVTPNSFVDCHGYSLIFTILVGTKWYHLVPKWIFLCACWLLMHSLLSIIQSFCPSLQKWVFIFWSFICSRFFIFWIKVSCITNISSSLALLYIFFNVLSFRKNFQMQPGLRITASCHICSLCSSPSLQYL